MLGCYKVAVKFVRAVVARADDGEPGVQRERAEHLGGGEAVVAAPKSGDRGRALRQARGRVQGESADDGDGAEQEDETETRHGCAPCARRSAQSGVPEHVARATA